MFNYKITKEDGADLTIRGGSICYVSAEKLVAQSVYMALQLNVGDYKFDATKGTPWNKLFLNKLEKEDILATFSDVISQVKGVKRIVSLNIDIKNQTRSAIISGIIQAYNDKYIQLTQEVKT